MHVESSYVTAKLASSETGFVVINTLVLYHEKSFIHCTNYDFLCSRQRWVSAGITHNPIATSRVVSFLTHVGWEDAC